MTWVVLLFLVAVSNGIELYKGEEGECNIDRHLIPRPHSVSILEFGAVADGKTVNTVAFQNAIFYLKSFTDKGGAQLYVPSGKWLTGSFNLTSHLTLFLEKDAVILGSEDIDHWKVIDPLPSYGRGIDLPGQRYRSLITGENLSDVVITGDNGTIDGQGFVWWDSFDSNNLTHSRPHIVEFINSKDIVISNITFLNPPAWTIHPAYCSNVLVQNITALSPAESPYTSGIVPDSCDSVCIENSNITSGHDAISLKSGWDEYGITYGRPTTNVHIKGVCLQSFTGSGLALGSEMSGGISEVLVENVKLRDSITGIAFLTSKGRGGYIKDVVVTDIDFLNIILAIKLTGDCTSHPDDKYDPEALPIVNGITFNNMVGMNITTAGNFSGILESPFTGICLSNISFTLNPEPSSSSQPWVCSNVSGFSENVSPIPCFELSNSSAVCSTLSSSHKLVAVL
ncbi:probable polygalacturonase [Cynara cardunculus var. scolymus]|uniref:probable polygalacturonase n=1 Tax=Cynara cardunculus var. scolymus TaxID=59895 RepID=UPI000D62DC03|nr:probable polygalacturonase [Cynara cardunculus var. scolymus]